MTGSPIMLPITTSDVKHIAGLPKYKGQEYLARKLQFGQVDGEEDLRSGILVDYYYDILQFAVNRGIRWKEVTSSLNFATSILQSITDKTFPDAIKNLQAIAYTYINEGTLSISTSKLLLQHVTSTLFAHFKLYQYVLTCPREDDSEAMRVVVEVPPTFMDLRDADSYKDWKSAQKMRAIDHEEEKRKAKLIDDKQKIIHEIEITDREQKFQLQKGDLDPIKLNMGQKLLTEMTSAKIWLAEKEIGLDVTDLKDAAEIAVARQALPVPRGNEVKNPATEKPTKKTKSPLGSRKSTGKKK